jgi:hypothetical protein
MNYYSVFALWLLLSAGCVAMDDKSKEPANTASEAGTAEAAPSATFVHTVFFWMQDSLSEENRQVFLEGLERLKTIETVQHGMVGTPAGTPRDVVDNSYDYALILHFADVAGQDAYQVDPIHQDFVAASQGFWERVQVYDTVLE